MLLNRPAGPAIRGTLLVPLALLAACSGLPTGPSTAPPTPLTLSVQSSGWQTIADPKPFPLVTNHSAQLPEYWSSVSGQFGHANSATRYGFATAVLNVSQLGLTFGGGCSFGHGINVRGGSATFQLTGYAIQ